MYIDNNMKKKIFYITGIIMIAVIFSIVFIPKKEVKVKPNENNKVTEVAINSGDLLLRSNDMVSLKTNTSNVNWQVDNGEVISVSNEGVVKALKPGTAIVTATSSNGTTDQIVINVTDSNDKYVVLTVDEITLYEKSSQKITPQLFPVGTGYKKMVWSSSNKNVSVDQNGKITGVKKGTSKVTLKVYLNSGKTLSRSINVKVIKKSASISHNSGNNSNNNSNNNPVKVVNPTSIKLGYENLTLNPNETRRISYSFSPSNASNSKVTWTSSNPSVVSVDQNGRITTLSPGTVVITAKTANNKTATVNVIVKRIDSTYVAINVTNVVLKPGTSYDLIARVYPNNAIDKKVYWYTSDTSIAIVDSNGRVTARKGGTVTITARTNNNLTSTSKIIVKEDIVETNGIKINSSDFNIKVGYSRTLSTTISPSNATNKSITWSSSNTYVATVNNNGTVTAINPGTATITAKTINGLKYSIKVTVESNVIETNGIMINSADFSLKVGYTKTLPVTISPSNATNKSITWSSSNSYVATVNGSGTVTAINVGIATITARTYNGLQYSVKVTVESNIINVSSINFDITYKEITVGDSITITPTVYPSNATNKTLTWFSSNTYVATVSNGTITGLKEGNVTITAKANNGIVKMATIIVKPKIIEVTAVKLTETNVVKRVGDTFQVYVLIYPATATYKNVTWSSSNSSVASVKDGKITVNKTGTATITATSNNGKTATLKITTEVLPTSIILNKNSLSLYANMTSQLTATIYPSNATNKTVTWTSSNPNVAIVTSGGLVVGKMSGTTIITAQTVNGKTYSILVTVPVVSPTAVNVTIPKYNDPKTYVNAPDYIYILRGHTLDLNASFEPITTTKRMISWQSNNTNNVLVDINGIITAKNVGSATILLTTENGKTDTLVVYVVSSYISGITVY